jgi:hypothetical protein
LFVYFTKQLFYNIDCNKTYEYDKNGSEYLIEIPLKYINKYKRIEKIKEVFKIYCVINKFLYNNFSYDFNLLIKNEF